jgi:hypothetical protein
MVQGGGAAWVQGLFQGPRGAYSGGASSYLADKEYRGVWVALHMPVSIAVTRVTWRMDRAVGFGSFPSDYRIYARNVPNSMGWTMLKDVVGANYTYSDPSDDSVPVHYSGCFRTTGLYNEYAIVVSRIHGTSLSYAQIAHVRLIEYPVRGVYYLNDASSSGSSGNNSSSSSTTSVFATLPVDCSEPGTFRESAGDLTCLYCPPGTSSSSSVAGSCVACGEGTFSAEYGSTVCLTCPVGTFTSK